MPHNVPPKTPADPQFRDSKSALLQAAQAAIADGKTKQGSGRRGGGSAGRSVFRGALAVIALAGAVVLIIQPGWLVGPPLPAEEPAIKRASAMLVLVQEMDRIRSFQARSGRLPTSLTEAGSGTPDVTYKVRGDADYA
ncbi:MAG: hypothetical protein ABI647_15170, partial [Gemmatimonadota bacterium]